MFRPKAPLTEPATPKAATPAIIPVVHGAPGHPSYVMQTSVPPSPAAPLANPLYAAAALQQVSYAPIAPAATAGGVSNAAVPLSTSVPPTAAIGLVNPVYAPTAAVASVPASPSGYANLSVLEEDTRL